MAKPLNFETDPQIRCREFKIGCIGAGFIMADVQLSAYAMAGFPVVAIASRRAEKAAEVADRWKIPAVHQTPRQLIEDTNIEIVDIAFPPDQQPDLIRHALKQKHVRGILAQKPLAMDFWLAKELVEEAAATDKVLSVNQNMRFDQSMRVLKQLIGQNELGTPILGTIEMRAIPHWQPFLASYQRLTLLNMSIHHLDVLRFLFGDPTEIYTAVRRDPRTEFEHTDGITISTLKFPSEVLAMTMEDVWSGPRQEGFDSDIYIKWRVEGLEGVAQGTIGWPDYPAGSPSTLRYCSRKTTDGHWVQPSWDTRWFPHAFAGVMEQLQYALKTGTEPMLSASDNLKTMALVEAAYRSVQESRAVQLAEFAF
ncbi:MAG: Gfo/Idh/MocA family oxidoreductase [Verrucomicrobia bacterium]|nr:Gfo/Idh/MocA family oxidoreductase [Verrucomicrobiota bacterium]MBV9274000.1 Gfo/Idh/MocA family oxidoreductase [Verrucomicrobiota bacterium]